MNKNIPSPVSDPFDEAGDLTLLAGIDLPVKDDGGLAFIDENSEAVPGISGSRTVIPASPPTEQTVFAAPTPSYTSPIRKQPIIPPQQPQKRQAQQVGPVVKVKPPRRPAAMPVSGPADDPRSFPRQRPSVSPRSETAMPPPSFAPQSVSTSSVPESSAALSSYHPFAASDHHPHPLMRKFQPEMPAPQRKSALKPAQDSRKPQASVGAGEPGFHLDRYAQEEVKKYLAATRGVGAGVPELPRQVRRMVAAGQAAAAPRATTSPAPASIPVSAPSPAVGKATSDSLSLIIEKIIEQTHLSFEDAVQRSRFVTLVRSRLRDVRDKFELADGLMRSEKIGGLGYPEHRANEIAELVEQEALHYLGIKEKRSAPLKSAAIPISAPVRSAPSGSVQPAPREPQTAPSAPTTPPKPTTYRSAVLDKLVDLQKVHHTSTVDQKKSASLRRSTRPQTGQKPSPRPRPGTFPQVIRPTITTDHRPTMTDVQQPQMIRKIDIMGPIDELSGMTLVNFRRLGVSAEMRAQKIREKIELLEQDSFALRTQGVESWKNSEVNRLYLLLGQESIVQGSPIVDVIREKENKQQATLSLEEFNSIADLNKSLRY